MWKSRKRKFISPLKKAKLLSLSTNYKVTSNYMGRGEKEKKKNRLGITGKLFFLFKWRKKRENKSNDNFNSTLEN